MHRGDGGRMGMEERDGNEEEKGGQEKTEGPGN